MKANSIINRHISALRLMTSALALTVHWMREAHGLYVIAPTKEK